MSQCSRLAGRKALVVGATTPDGIGISIAHRYRAEGAQVVIAGIEVGETAKLAEEIGSPFIAMDVLDEASIANGVAEAIKAMGGLDIMVNAAGVNRACLIADETAEGLTFIARLHFVGTTLLFRYAAAAMDKGGVMLTMSSVTAERPGFNLAAYAGTKAGADTVVKIAAQEFGAKGIRVNSIAPGITRTPMTESYFAQPAVVAAHTAETPIGRLTTVENVASVAVWLASDECIATGECVRASGGLHLRRLPTARDIETYKA